MSGVTLDMANNRLALTIDEDHLAFIAARFDPPSGSSPSPADTRIMQIEVLDDNNAVEHGWSSCGLSGKLVSLPYKVDLYYPIGSNGELDSARTKYITFNFKDSTCGPGGGNVQTVSPPKSIFEKNMRFGPSSLHISQWRWAAGNDIAEITIIMHDDTGGRGLVFKNLTISHADGSGIVFHADELFIPLELFMLGESQPLNNFLNLLNVR